MCSLVVDSRYQVLFEPVRIGPVVAKNRFYQVPHCTGMGWSYPRSLAELRGMKAEGGWGVVNTEYCSIHASADTRPANSSKLWDSDDIRAHALMVDKVRAHGALAGVELFYGGISDDNKYSRQVAMDVHSFPTGASSPGVAQTRQMDKDDIRNLRRWHRDAALRAREAGFQVVYVYAAHGYLLNNFLDSSINQRSDEYGGSLENRTRLFREILQETKEAVGDTCAVAVRYAVDGAGVFLDDRRSAEAGDIFESVANMPDLWDIVVPAYDTEMGSSRFTREAALEKHMTFVKSVTDKPVVTVGRFTSPDTMVDQVKRGITDFVGAARPSIADPFLPRKIMEGRIDDIRECIGCNICYAHDSWAIPLRCTQNPTMGEEWRLGWHPEKVPERDADESVLIVGAGPAGLEAAHVLGKRGYRVMLAEATRELGGRVSREARLPGLREWARVRDYRVHQISKLPNVEVFRESHLVASDVLDIAPDHIAVATGSEWRRDGVGRSNLGGIPGLADDTRVYTPDDLMSGKLPTGRVTIFDDDAYYMGPVLAELLAKAGCDVTLVSPYQSVSVIGRHTEEQASTFRLLAELGVTIELSRNLKAIDGAQVALECVYTERECRLASNAIVLVTARVPRDRLYKDLRSYLKAGSLPGLKSLSRIGDCDAPALIGWAVYSGYQFARNLGCDAESIPLPKVDAPFTSNHG
jgi:dimethylamine/trimethylamine dehydrogenase